VQLRTATPDDAPALAGLELAVAHHAYADLEPVRVDALDPDDLAGEWAARLGDPDCNVVRVGAAGGRFVAAASWRVARRTEEASVDDGTLTHLMVHPAAQNSGVGSALLTDAEATLRALGASTARLDLHPEAWWAARFVEARGWEHEAGAPPGAQPQRTWRRAL
jgi:GNAT superfamily N-acetyltransferase